MRKNLILLVVLLLTVVAFGSVGAKEATVGGFLQELAGTLHLNAADARIAADSLRAVGVALPADLELDRPLTQRDVVAISRASGLRLTTRQPDAAFSQEQVSRFFDRFSSELGLVFEENPGQGSGPGSGESGPPFDPFTKARGKGLGKAKFNRTPTDAG